MHFLQYMPICSAVLVSRTDARRSAAPAGSPLAFSLQA